MGRPRRLQSIRLTLIPPETYPRFQTDPEHRFMKLSDEDRLEEVVRICARVHAEAQRQWAYEQEPLRKIGRAA